jgi:hypothetical protein
MKQKYIDEVTSIEALEEGVGRLRIVIGRENGSARKKAETLKNKKSKHKLRKGILRTDSLLLCS